MTKHEIIIEIGKLEDKLEFATTEETKEIDKQIRELGKQLESVESNKKRTRHHYPFTVEEIEALANDYTNEEIAEMFHIDVERVGNFKSHHHIKGKKKSIKKFDVSKKELERLLKKLSTKQIAKMYNVSPVTVNQHKRKFGLVVPRKEKLTKDKLEQLAPIMTNFQIATRYGLSEYTVKRYKSMWRIKGIDARRRLKFKKEEA